MTTRVILVAALVAACGSDGDEDGRTLATEDSFVIADLFSDQGGAPITATTPPATPIYKIADATTDPPILAAVVDPAGAPVTWGAFAGARAHLDLACTGEATELTVAYEGLVPDAVYTLWLVYAAAPGLFEGGLAAVTGEGALGAADGSEARFETDAAGRGTLSGTVAAGPVPVVYADPAPVPPCLLDAYEVHVLAAYHLDGQTYGMIEGPPDVVAEHVDVALHEGAVLAP